MAKELADALLYDKHYKQLNDAYDTLRVCILLHSDLLEQWRKENFSSDYAVIIQAQIKNMKKD